MSEIDYSLIIPVYRSEACLPALLEALRGMHDQLSGGFEVIFVIDGSPDNSYDYLDRHLPDLPFPSLLVLHSRNFGAFSAARTGLAHASGRYSAVMAADQQEPPELILQMYAELDKQEAEVVVAVRDSRSDPWLSKLFSALFWWFFRRFVMPEMPAGGVGTVACNREFRDELLKLEERQSSMIGLIFWLGFRRKEIRYERRERAKGKSSWNFRAKLNYLLDSVFSFSDLPIKVLIAAGSVGLFMSMLMGSVLFLSRLIGLIDSVPGYAATMITILFFGCINTIGLGIIGAYVWRAFGNTQRRPSAVVMRTKRIMANVTGNSDG